MKIKLANSNPSLLVWWNSLQNKEAGLWLEVLPLYEKLTMTSSTFRTALRYRLFMRMDGMIDGLKCTCKGKINIDPRGHHLATGCGVSGIPKITHDAIVHELDCILKYCGSWTRKEERGLFQNVDPDCNLRPDISIINPIGTTQKRLLLDVAVTSPLQGAGKGLVEVTTSSDKFVVGKQMNKTHNAKIRKYKALCDTSGFGFRPIVFESTGLMHEELLSLLKSSAQHAADLKHIPAATLQRYFSKRLSVTLQSHIAEGMLSRLADLKSHCRTCSGDPSFATNVILEV